MGEVIALPRRPRGEPPEPQPPTPAAPAMARPSRLTRIGFRAGLELAALGEPAAENAGPALLRGHRLGRRLLGQTIIDWQPVHSRARRLRRLF